MILLQLILLTAVLAQSDAWFRGLDTTLKNVGCQDFAAALASSRPSITWNESTIYCPTTFDVGDNTVRYIAYHIVSGTLNSTDVARPRQQTIALTNLVEDNQAQALILETAPSEDRILVRGSDWNVSSIGNQVSYEGLHVQPVERPFLLPPPPSVVLGHALHSTAPQGAPEFLSLVSAEALDACRRCTFLVPNDDAVRAANLSSFGAGQRQAIINNHILRQVTAYTPSLSNGQLLVTAAGRALVFGSIGTNAFVTGAGSVSVILRSNIVAQSSVIHLVNTLITDTTANDDLASSVLSSRSAVLATQTTIPGVIGRPATSAASPSPPTSSSAGQRKLSTWF